MEGDFNSVILLKVCCYISPELPLDEEGLTREPSDISRQRHAEPEYTCRWLNLYSKTENVAKTRRSRMPGCVVAK